MPPPPPPESLERQNRELAILNAIATALNGSVDLSESLEAALSHVAELLELEAGWVWLLREDDGSPYLAAARSLPPGLANRPETMEGGCYCLDTFRAGELGGAANVSVVRCSRLKWLEEGTGGLRYHASIPLEVRGEKLGVMNVASPQWRRLSPEDLRLLHTIGEMLGTAVERARLYRRSVEAGAAEERNRLAREIHDTIAQGLSGVALQLDTAEALLAGGAEPERVRAHVRAALEGTRRNLEEARRSVLDLRAAPLEGRTLAEALEELTSGGGEAEEPAEGRRGAGQADARGQASAGERPQGADPPRVEFEAVGGSRPLPARVESALYRVAQEALSNARRHAAAGRVRVRLAAEPDRVRLTVEDDGRGMDPEATPSRGFGLVGMRERLRLLGGELRVESEPGEGTRVEASAPLDRMATSLPRNRTVTSLPRDETETSLPPDPTEASLPPDPTETSLPRDPT